MNELGNLLRELGAHQRFFWITNSNVRKDILAAFLVNNGFAHDFTLTSSFLACSSRSLINLTSCFGVSFPFFDFFWKQ
jgi:hypothetical protein